MSSYVFSFQDIDQTKITVVGGKGANLGELSNIAGIRVLKPLKESLRKHRQLTNYSIGYRF